MTRKDFHGVFLSCIYKSNTRHVTELGSLPAPAHTLTHKGISVQVAAVPQPLKALGVCICPWSPRPSAYGSVSPQRGLVRECPPTGIAHEWLLARVDPVMTLQGVELGELLPTLVATVGPLACDGTWTMPVNGWVSVTCWSNAVCWPREAPSSEPKAGCWGTHTPVAGTVLAVMAISQRLAPPNNLHVRVVCACT